MDLRPPALYPLTCNAAPAEHFSGGLLSPVSQRPRAAAPRRPDPNHQHWGMLLFESLSAGVMTIFAGFVLVTIIVGVYVIIIWPLTFWDLANLGLEKYHSWINPLLWSVFAAGSLAGFLCFGGAAFKTRQKARMPGSTRSTR